MAPCAASVVRATLGGADAESTCPRARRVRFSSHSVFLTWGRHTRARTAPFRDSSARAPLVSTRCRSRDPKSLTLTLSLTGATTTTTERARGESLFSFLEADAGAGGGGVHRLVRDRGIERRRFPFSEPTCTCARCFPFSPRRGKRAFFFRVSEKTPDRDRTTLSTRVVRFRRCSRPSWPS